MSFFSDIGDFFESIPTAITSVFHGITEPISTVYSDARSIVTTLHDDVKGVANRVGDIADKGLDKAGSILSNLTSPMSLLLIGGGVLLFMNMKSGQASMSMPSVARGLKAMTPRY